MKHKLLLIGILVLGFSLRVFGLNWDQGSKLHPDERAIIMNVTNPRFHWPQDAREWSLVLTPDSSLNPQWFPYGSLPLYLLKFAGSVASYIDPAFGQYDQINLVGRLISAIFDTGTILLVFLLGRRLIDRNWGLVAAFLYATTVLPIQLSHFYAVDIPMTFFITMSMYWAIHLMQDKTLKPAIFLGVCVGLALATKVSAAPVVVPAVMAIIVAFARSSMSRLVLAMGIFGAMTAITFAMAMPYALIDFQLFYRQVTEQQAMTRDAWTFPYTLQYVGKIRYWHELKNLFLWGMGPVVAVPAMVGVVGLTIKQLRRFTPAIFVPVSFFWLFFGIVGSFAVGFIRYLAPVYPLLALFAATLLRHIRLPKLAVVGFLLLALVWPAAFMTIYTKPNSRTTASEWLYAHLPGGLGLGREHWEDGLPLGGPHTQNPELPMYEPDTNPQKWITVNKILQEQEYIVIASNRLYVPLMKLTDCEKLKPRPCYVRTTNFYNKLFSGNLGFRLVAEFWVKPTLPLVNIPINDFEADETFTVYDHPRIMIFQKVPGAVPPEV